MARALTVPRTKDAYRKRRWLDYRKRVKRLRKRAKRAPTIQQVKGLWSLRDIARATGVRRNHVYSILHGHKEPKLSTAVRIARFLCIRVEDLADYLTGLKVLKGERRGRAPYDFRADELDRQGLDPTISTE